MWREKSENRRGYSLIFVCIDGERKWNSWDRALFPNMHTGGCKNMGGVDDNFNSIIRRDRMGDKICS